MTLPAESMPHDAEGARRAPAAKKPASTRKATSCTTMREHADRGEEERLRHAPVDARAASPCAASIRRSAAGELARALLVGAARGERAPGQREQHHRQRAAAGRRPARDRRCASRSGSTSSLRERHEDDRCPRRCAENAMPIARDSRARYQRDSIADAGHHAGQATPTPTGAPTAGRTARAARASCASEVRRCRGRRCRRRRPARPDAVEQQADQRRGKPAHQQEDRVHAGQLRSASSRIRAPAAAGTPRTCRARPRPNMLRMKQTASTATAVRWAESAVRALSPGRTPAAGRRGSPDPCSRSCPARPTPWPPAGRCTRSS